MTVTSSATSSATSAELDGLRLALTLARRGLGRTSPNPAVGAVILRGRRILGRGWHRRAGFPHAEIEAIQDARRAGHSLQGATLCVTLEPCSTHGRTPPCTDALIAARLRRIVVGCSDPNPAHAGRASTLLRNAGLSVVDSALPGPCLELNRAFNHWITARTPYVLLKSAMSLDGRIATATGESRWITGEKARTLGMRLRHQSDAILVGIGTVLADDPLLTVRNPPALLDSRPRWRIVLDTHGRTPPEARLFQGTDANPTLIVVGPGVRKATRRALEARAQVWQAPLDQGRVSIPWILAELGKQSITALLVEGGGTVLSAFLQSRLAHELAFFYAPLVLGGARSPRSVGGTGATQLDGLLRLSACRWSRCGPDLVLRALLPLQPLPASEA